MAMTAQQLNAVVKILTPDADYGKDGVVEGFEITDNGCDSYPDGTINLLMGYIHADETEVRSSFNFIAPDGTEIAYYEI